MNRSRLCLVLPLALTAACQPAPATDVAVARTRAGTSSSPCPIAVGTVTDSNHPTGIDNPNQFFVFAIDAAQLPGYGAQKLHALF